MNKAKLNNILENLISRKTLTSVVLILIWLTFKEQIHSQIDNYKQLNEFLQLSITDIYLIDAFYLTFLIILIIYRSINKFRYSKGVLIFRLCLIIICLAHLKQLSSHIEEFCTWGVVICIFGYLSFPFLLEIRYLKKNKIKNRESPYILEKDINNEELDILDYKDISNRVIEYIEQIHNKKSFAIGITKNCGSGKTTFLKYLEKGLSRKDKNAIIINYSPWICRNECDIISSFFNLISTKLKRYHSSINIEFAKYIKILFYIHENKATKTIEKLIDIDKNKEDFYHLFNTINNILEAIDRRIYILIDDIDRLNIKEIIEIFRIVRNTANFRNTVFILAYDSKYINTLISKEFDTNIPNYLDNIFLAQFELPQVAPKIIRNYIVSTIQYNLQHLKNSNKEIQIDRFLEYYKSNGSIIKIEDKIKSIKDCNNILNAFFTKIFFNREADIYEIYWDAVINRNYSSLL